MQDVHQRKHGATAVYEDIDGAVEPVNNSMLQNTTTKHINIKHHYIRELVNTRTVAVVTVGTADMLANGLKKVSPEPKHAMIIMRGMEAAPSGD
jgi:hypothetical protein